MKRGELLRLIIAEALLLALGGSCVGVALDGCWRASHGLSRRKQSATLFSLVDLAESTLAARLALALGSGSPFDAAALHPAGKRSASAAGKRPTSGCGSRRPGKRSWPIVSDFSAWLFSNSPTARVIRERPVEKFSVGVVGMLFFSSACLFFARRLSVMLSAGSGIRPAIAGLTWVEARLAIG